MCIMSLLLVSGFGVAFAAPGPSFQGKCTTTVATDNLTNNAVQLAINAAKPGATICVGSVGTTIFPEQLTIAKPLTLLGLIVNQNTETVTTIQPTTLATTANGLNTGQCPTNTSCPEAPIILVSGTMGVTIKDMFIDGSMATGSVDSGCGAPSMVGIEVQDSSVNINSVATENTAQETSLFGCQSSAGLGINVESSASGNANVMVNNVVVSTYQKNGITCDDANTMCTIQQTSVGGIGQTTLTAQNGIQISDGATANINNVIVADNAYAPAEYPTLNCGNYATFTGYTASGILLFDSGKVTLSHNELDQNDVGVYAYNDGLEGAIPALKMTSNVYGGSYESGNYCQAIVYDGVSGSTSNDQINPPMAGTYPAADMPEGVVAAASSHSPVSVTANGETFGAFPPGTVFYQAVPPATLTVK